MAIKTQLTNCCYIYLIKMQAMLWVASHISITSTLYPRLYEKAGIYCMLSYLMMQNKLNVKIYALPHRVLCDIATLIRGLVSIFEFHHLVFLVIG